MQFEYLLGSISVDTFSDNYWDKAALHVLRGDPLYYSDILNRDHIIEYMERNDIRYPAVKLYKNGKELDGYEYLFPMVTRGFNNEKLFYDPRLADKRNDGTLVVIEEPEYAFPSLASWKSSIESELKFRVRLSVIWHPQEMNEPFIINKANTFVLQLHDFTNIEIKEDLLLDDNCEPNRIVLKAGELLFIPGGATYRICSGHSDGLYLNVHLEAPTWHDIIGELIYNLNEDNVAFRKAILPHLAGEINYADQLAEAKKIMAASADLEKQLNSLNKNVIVGEEIPEHRGRLLGYLDADNLSLSTIIAYRDIKNINRIKNGDSIDLSFNGLTLSLSLNYDAAIEKILKVKNLKVDEISDLLSANEKIEFTKGLIKKGFLKVHHE